MGRDAAGAGRLDVFRECAAKAAGIRLAIAIAESESGDADGI